MFVEAGGLLLAGTDPTGAGGAVPGFASIRQIQLLVEEGFSFEQAVRIGTLNGARYLGRDREIGSIEVGKRADLILVDGDPVRDPAALGRIQTVFKAGVGYDRQALLDSRARADRVSIGIPPRAWGGGPHAVAVAGPWRDLGRPSTRLAWSPSPLPGRISGFRSSALRSTS